jgi:hypothetical protein
MFNVSNLTHISSGQISLSDRTLTHVYNAVDELLSVSDHKWDGNITRNINYTRDNLGRATTIATNHITPNLTSLALTQKFDAVGNRTELSARVNGTPDFKNTYAYDQLNRLSEVTQAGQAGATWIKPKRVTQEFNALGQRTQISRFESLTTANPVATTDFVYDFANRLGSISHKQADYQPQYLQLCLRSTIAAEQRELYGRWFD